MSTARFERIAELFVRATELPPKARQEFLRDACGGDVALRNEVVSMLHHDAQPPDLARTGAMVALGFPEAAEPLPAYIGPYRVVRPIGKGGMGVVYLAQQQQPIRRQVAVKLIRPEIESGQFIARFESERRALALMNHPNIARVFDAGTTPEGRPYLVMEHVTGEPITSYCDARRLGIEERLRLFLEVCAGVAHAHRNAVIHRDLKPSNILVSQDAGVPVPKIIDFGIAKVLDAQEREQTSATEIGQVLGTTGYMSPEQLSGGQQVVDTRTDVYSLGVTLYELLVGSRPFDSSGAMLHDQFEIRRRIQHDEPVRPSLRAVESGSAQDAADKRGMQAAGLARRLRGDLDWITTRALEKEPARRYASPQELAADLQRHLDHEPVLAGPPTVGYRLGRLLRKHRAASLLIGLLLVTWIGFTVTTVVQAVRISREAARANREAAAASKLTDFLLKQYEVTPRVGRELPRSQAIDAFAAGAEKARRELAEWPVLQARFVLAMGQVYQASNELGMALPLVRSAHEQLAKLLGEDDPMTVAAAESLAGVLTSLGRYDEAQPLLVHIVASRTSRVGRHDTETYRALTNLGYNEKWAGRSDRAAAVLEESAAGLARLAGEDHPHTLVARGLLVGAYLELGRFAEAEVLARENLPRMQRVLGDRNFETLIAVYNLGCIYANLGDERKALDHLRAAQDRGFHYPVTMAEDRLLVALHDEPEFRELERRGRFTDLPLAHARLGVEVLRRDQGLAAAEEFLREAIDGSARRHGTLLQYDGFLLQIDLSDLYLRAGRYEEAEAVLAQASEAFGLDSTNGFMEALALVRLAQCAIHSGHGHRAMELVERSLSLNQRGAHTHAHAYAQAMRHALAGEREDALRFLTLAADRGYADPDWLRRDLAFAALRGDRRFAAVVARVERQELTASRASP